MTRGGQNLIAGAVFAMFGAAILLIAWQTLPMGQLSEMGPGSFPATIGAVLMGLGIVIAMSPSAIETPQEPARPIAWRGGFFLVAAIVFAALMIERLGLLPTVVVSSLLGAFASARMTLRFALPLTVGLTLIALFIFKFCLNLPIPLWGRWLQG